MVTPFVTGTYPGDFAHLGMCLLSKTKVLLRCVITMWEKHILTRGAGIQKENWRWPCIFRYNWVSIWNKNTGSVLRGILCRLWPLRSLWSLSAGVEEKLSDRNNHMKNRRAKRKTFSQTAFQCTNWRLLKQPREICSVSGSNYFVAVHNRPHS